MRTMGLGQRGVGGAIPQRCGRRGGAVARGVDPQQKGRWSLRPLRGLDLHVQKREAQQEEVPLPAARSQTEGQTFEVAAKRDLVWRQVVDAPHSPSPAA